MATSLHLRVKGWHQRPMLNQRGHQSNSEVHMADRNIELHKMTKEEFQDFLNMSIEDYAQEIARSFKRPVDESKKDAEEQTESLLKHGVNTPSHFLFSAVDQMTDKTVGAVWLNVDGEKKRAFLYSIHVYPQFRGKGYGGKIMEEVEKVAKGMDAKYLGLHVNDVCYSVAGRGFQFEVYKHAKSPTRPRTWYLRLSRVCICRSVSCGTLKAGKSLLC